jgi:hypothetical protein
MEAYRQRTTGPASKRRTEPLRRAIARVFVDLDEGELDYGLADVTQQNALYLLEPLLELGSDLLRIYME